MNKGISFYFGYKYDKADRARDIKKYGFDTVITNADEAFDKQNGTIEEQIELFKKNGLKLSSLHSRYVSDELPEFFKEGEVGDKLENNLVKDVLVAKKYGFNSVVVHLFGQANEIGFERLRRVLKVCEETKIPLAIENINDQKTFVATFENVKSDYLKFCYDSGHNNAFDPDFDYLEKYGDKLVCLHLHDNGGKNDDHTINKYGTINWDNIAKKLSKLPDVNLDYELLMYKRSKESAEEILQEVSKQAVELEEKIKFYRNKNS
jgi:sugar phosphate isomerase/epimerase